MVINGEQGKVGSK